MIRIDGDFAKLEHFAFGLREFSARMPGIMQAIGNAAVGLTRESFRNQASPWGAKWDKKQCRDGRQTLVRTGTMKASYHVKAHSSTSVTIGPGVFYAHVHQGGAVIHAKNKPFLAWKCGKKWRFAKSVRIPARPMVPERNALPPVWEQEFADIVDAAVSKVFR